MLFLYSSSAFDISIDCKDVNGRTANEWKLYYDRNDYDIIKSEAQFICNGQSVGLDFINRLPNKINLEDGDSFEWYDLYNISYEAIRNQNKKTEYTDTVKTEKNTFIRHAEWSGNDTNTYRIQISITND
jgi:hypothetical protein